jgi:antirestriction protein ArdC
MSSSKDNTRSKSDKATVYEIITERIIERIETEGRLPWHKPWIEGFARNLVSKKHYRGSNVWLLNMAPFTSPYWLTFKQAQSLGGTVRKGEKGWPVVYWQWFETKDKLTGETKNVPLLRYYTVFNLQQCEGIEAPESDSRVMNAVESLDACESVIQGMSKRPEIRHERNQAFYSPQFDYVNMPKKEMFHDAPSYYHTLFHELTHSTGHESRLGRLKGDAVLAKFGSEPYAKEELVAELGASYLSGVAGIQSTQEDNSIAYLQGWIKALKNDPKLLVQASAQAQKAADFILGTTFESEGTED